MKLTENVAIITGAANGIGQAIAIRLSQLGVKPVLVDLNSCEETIQQLHNSVEYAEFKGDIRDKSFVNKVVDETIEKYGAIHILVNNAGTCGRQGLEDLDEDTWERDLDTNAKAAYLFTQAIIHPHMIEEEYGRIINISSVSGINGGVLSRGEGFETGGRSGAAYAASKGAMIAFTRWIAKEYGPVGITCNTIAPGATETGITKGMAYDLSQQVVKRIGTPEDIAEAVCYFASPNSSYTTGQTLKVDGGVHIG